MAISLARLIRDMPGVGCSGAASDKGQTPNRVVA
jgi:hypothetical protein